MAWHLITFSAPTLGAPALALVWRASLKVVLLHCAASSVWEGGFGCGGMGRHGIRDPFSGISTPTLGAPAHRVWSGGALKLLEGCVLAAASEGGGWGAWDGMESGIHLQRAGAAAKLVYTGLLEGP